MVDKPIEDVARAFEQFKDANDERLAQIEAKQASDPLTEEKLTKINAAIDAGIDAGREQEKRLADLEVSAARPAKGDQSPEAAEHSKAFGAFMRRGVEDGLRDLEIKASASVGSDPDGGYFVPDEMATEIGRIASSVSSMRSLAQVVSISASSYKKMVGVGGAGSGWVAEKEARPETATPDLKSIDIPADEVYANPFATQKILDDAAVNVEAWLADEVAIKFGEVEGAAFISGTGVGQPRGILGYTPAAIASYAWGNPGFVVSGQATTLAADLDPFVDQVTNLKMMYRGNANWIMNRATVGEVRKLKDGDSQYLWQPSNIAGQAGTVLGYPISDDDNMPDIGAGAYAVAFGDFRQAYLIVDRMGVRVLRDPYTSKPYVSFYTTKRVGGAVQNFEAYNLQKISA